MWPRSLAWSPTIALTWLWGLGFFYAIHVTFLYGWPGFLAFALPNAVGLGLFGCLIEWFGPRTDLEGGFGRLSARYGGILLVFQVMATAITLFAFAADYLHPLIGSLAIPVTLLLALLASAVGHVVRIQDFKILHGVMLAVGVTLAFAALHLLPVSGLLHTAPTPGPRFYGLIVPSLVGFLLGPWLDVQHWQRALRIRQEGASIARAYAAGGLLFFCLIAINAAFAASLPATSVMQLHRGLDGIAEAPSILAASFAAIGPTAAPAAWLFGLWASIAVVSTIDSAYAATRWFLISVTTRSSNPVFALLPRSLVQTPLWMLLAAFAVAGTAYAANAPLLLLMAPFATLFVGYAACLLLQVTHRAGIHDPMLCFLLGIAASACFAIGYYAQLVPMMAISSLLPLLAAVPLLTRPAVATPDQATSDAIATATTATVAKRSRSAVPETADVPGEGWGGSGPLMGRFDGNWFQYDVIPTYDDTNSVGNVYFANYMRWVGKTRELFFARCVPNFDLKTTNFFILTRDFYHKFVRETREFEAILVRIRVGKHNRKFVTLEHEILSADGGLLGKGSQQLMFVDVASYQLIDVPVDMLRGFLPYVTNAPAGA